MREHDSGRDAAPLPVVDALQNTRPLRQTEQRGELAIAADRTNQRLGLRWGHAVKGKRTVDLMSNKTLTILEAQEVNATFSMVGMAESIEKQAFTDLLRRLKAKGVDELDYFKERGWSKQRVYNYRNRGLPLREHRKVAASLGISAAELVPGDTGGQGSANLVCRSGARPGRSGTRVPARLEADASGCEGAIPDTCARHRGRAGQGRTRRQAEIEAQERRRKPHGTVIGHAS